MKVLLTGSHGFLGTHIRETLKHEFDCWDYKINRRVENIRSEDLKGIDAIVHLAASISVPESFKKPITYFANNTMSTLVLVSLAKAAGIKKFIFPSSAAVYANPLSPYGASKLSAEHILDCYKISMNIHILRLFNVYGKGQSKEYAGVITKFIDQIKDNKPITLHGDGSQTRDFIYVGDVVKIIDKLLTSNMCSDVPIDIATHKRTSILELAETLKKLYKKDPPYSRYELENESIKHSIGKKTPKALIEEMTTLEEGLKLTI